ncbi:Ubiquitin-activating enzyme E1-like [Colletotrichum siamense]|uniref:Ubiquitin-activating enzyme E1-like n=1 Tax=Colletotrichum siamense TaxID=690259 RepID=A0A9P5BM59_COLSI|nr:Ubiquitin-activating enzyme E1-like [Colletotrichum siamense]KAF4852013.1 Ubiquitin-activating enzyme E1-like [Colletotrichum siamense]
MDSNTAADAAAAPAATTAEPTAPLATTTATAAATATETTTAPKPQEQQQPAQQQQQPAAAPAAQPPAQTAQKPIAVPRRDKFYQQSLGGSLNANVKKARVLMVGAGGIGCELLKNLVLTGYGEIHVVDLDTIDLSNLNRQFLFRHEHIKKSKALVAKDAAQAFNPKVKIVAHHANIKDSQFNTRWFKDFNIVFNALDNLEARRHVNRMCLAADVPLIESGTTGFNGNVQVIKKGVTACYDCTPKETPKSFPVCTIRSTPSQPIHCIVWGKSYLLSEIFGASEDESAFDNSADADNAKEIEELKKEAAALRAIRDALGTEAFPQLLFDKVYNSDIVRLASMEDMWKSRRKPEPLDYKKLLEQSTEASGAKASILQEGQKVWSLEENFAVFVDSLDRLSKRMQELKKAHQNGGAEPLITFDKDDEDTLDFVTASANIRSSIFGIERKSRFDIKQMAGNIIPAIATTNAIVAGLCVLQSFKVLKGEYTNTKEVFISPHNPARLLNATKYRAPNPECPVCSVYQTTVSVDMSRATLKDLVEDFVRLELGYGDKEFALNNDAGPLYDPDETENLSKKLSELGITEDTFLTVIDEDDDEPFVNVVISIQESKEPLEDKPVKGMTADQKPEIPRKPKKETPAPPAAESNGTSQQNGKHSLDVSEESPNLKRPRPDDGDEPIEAKKAKVATTSSSDDVVLVDDSTGGAIVIDD